MTPTTMNTLLNFFLLLSLAFSSPSSLDFYPLQSFKASSDPAGSLSSWGPATDPCSSSWRGVSCRGARVTKLELENLDLNNTIQPLSLLPRLTLLSLKNNSFSDPLHLLNLSLWQPHLKLLYLSDNRLSGPFPESVLLLRHLRRLDLSGNLFSGTIPACIGVSLPFLLTLRLEKNFFSGEIPSSICEIQELSDLNVSYNRLVGEISENLLSLFPSSSFVGNPGLHAKSNHKKSKKHWRLVIFLIVIVVAAALAMAGTGFLIFKKRRSRKEDGVKENKGGTVKGTDREERLVFFEGCREFLMEDLMRGSAEMIGRGAVGSTYRVVIDGSEDMGGVVVKRVRKERLGKEKREYWAEVERFLGEMGRWRHPNAVSLLAYYSSDDELLLVFEFVTRGSLHNLLHGNRGPGRTPLGWRTRLNLALTAAKGLTYLHEASKSELSHQHLTSSNILIAEDGAALISDFALHQLLVPLSPNMNLTVKNNSKCDVYGFGVVLLELLTGKTRGEGETDLAKWVQMVVREEWTSEVFDIELLSCKENEDEMVALLQVALLCLSRDSKDRPKMGAVHRMIEDIKERGFRRGRGTISPSLYDNSSDESSPGVSDDTAVFTSN